MRTGHGLERIYRTGARALGTRDALRAEALQVLASAFGGYGARKRANVRKMQARFDGVWAGEGGGGESVRATEAFLRDLGL